MNWDRFRGCSDTQGAGSEANVADEPVTAQLTLPEPLSQFSRCVEMENVSFVPCGGTLEVDVPAFDSRVFRFRFEDPE